MANGHGYYGSICIDDLFQNAIVKNAAGASFIQLDKLKDAPFNKSPKNGKTYVNIGLWVNDETDEFGNVAGITLSQTEADRKAQVKRTYIGNLKRSGSGGGSGNREAEQHVAAISQASQSKVPSMDDLPF